VARETVELERISCDRCGTEVDRPSLSIAEPARWLKLAVGGRSGPEVDLCPKCNEEHADFMRGQR
jgi:hypothetical protein